MSRFLSILMTMSDWPEDVIDIINLLVIRDTQKRGRSIDNVLVAYNRFVKKAYDEYIKPVKVNF
jgi:uridine kinase